MLKQYLTNVLICALVLATAAHAQYNETSISPRLASAKFIAGLFWQTTVGTTRRCAATIVTNNVLVTSAACAQDAHPRAVYGAGKWVVVAGTEDRYQSKLNVKTKSYIVKHIDSLNENNLAFVSLESPLTLNGQVAAIGLSNATIGPSTIMNGFKTVDPTDSHLLVLTQGANNICQGSLPTYQQQGLLCTQPVESQDVTTDYLGGDPIIGYSVNSGTASSVLLAVSGQYYSTSAAAQSAQTNDPSAYRFNGLVGQHIDKVSMLAGVAADSLVSNGVLYS